MTLHSKIVGGSTAKRVINCPGSVALVEQMPPQVENDAMREGTMLHELVSECVDQSDAERDRLIAEADLTDSQEWKLRKALELFDTHIDPDLTTEFDVETRVSLAPGIFGTADVIGQRKDDDGELVAIVLDWKFGDGVMVEAEENEQLMFYGAGASHQESWVFGRRPKYVREVDLVIIQPPHIRIWRTTTTRLNYFRRDLLAAVEASQQPDAPIVTGDHCRFCPAKSICPVMTDAVERATRQKIIEIKPERLGEMMQLAEFCEDWASDVKKLALQALEKNLPVPGYKLVPKQARRSWVDEKAAVEQLQALAPDLQFMEAISPAQAEKLLKKQKIKMPSDLTVAVSSGLTIADEADPRPAAVTIGTTLVSALSKIV